MEAPGAWQVLSDAIPAAAQHRHTLPCRDTRGGGDVALSQVNFHVGS